MLDWMSAINAHIHVRYMAEWHIETDFWDRGNVESSFWKVCALLEHDMLLVYYTCRYDGRRCMDDLVSLNDEPFTHFLRYLTEPAFLALSRCRWSTLNSLLLSSF
jgi:hypothetical protein